mmetsp:Transcript_20639/g.79043  ORF Transcript_20639/g.79043 Transcript_20639/m.79043 type:complete len:211 (-) Transcript_20639:787-1419(-)
MHNRGAAPAEDLVNVFLREVVLAVLLIEECAVGAVLEEAVDLLLVERRRVLLRRLGGAAGTLHPLEHCLVETELARGVLEHVLLVGVAGDQAVDLHRLRLANAVAARLRLDVILGVPVAVVDHDSVGGGQVDAEAASPRGEEEDELRRARRVESVDPFLPVPARHAAVDAAELVALVDHVVFQHVQHPRHLREDQHSVPSLLQLRQHLVE